MQPTFRVVSHIYESGLDFPIVTHIFNGTSLEQARAVYKAHIGTDYFLAGCLKGRFKSISCREEHRAQRLFRGQWIDL